MKCDKDRFRMNDGLEWIHLEGAILTHIGAASAIFPSMNVIDSNPLRLSLDPLDGALLDRLFGIRDRRCNHCRGAAFIDVLEVWGPREFAMETCCEGLHEEAVDLMNECPKAAAELLNALGARELAGSPAKGVRRVVDVDGQLVLDWHLEIDNKLAFAKAKSFVQTHHRHCPPPAGWRFGAGIRNGQELIGVAMVGRPVARAFDHTKVVEVNRVCVLDTIDPQLVWNACSQFYGWSAREAKKRGFERIITYTMEGESGTSLIAAGWAIEAVVKGRSWNAPSRPREDKTPAVNKVRWGKVLRKPKTQAQGPSGHVQNAHQAQTGDAMDVDDFVAA